MPDTCCAIISPSTASIARRPFLTAWRAVRGRVSRGGGGAAAAAALWRARAAGGGGQRRTLFQLLVGELDRVVGLEAEEGVDLTRRLRVVLLSDRQLVHADERDDLEPARRRNRADRRDAARDVVEVEVLRRREQLVRRREELRTRGWGGGSVDRRQVGRRVGRRSWRSRRVAARPPAGRSAAPQRLLAGLQRRRTSFGPTVMPRNATMQMRPCLISTTRRR